MKEKKVTLKQIEKSLLGMELDDVIYQLDLQVKKTPTAGLVKLLDQYQRKKQKWQQEQSRFLALCKYENDAYLTGHRNICGVDEAGRGPLAGPVVAASVILPHNIFIENLNDSKKLSSKQRETIYHEILSNAIAWSVGIVEEQVIDTINILQATKLAMQKALQSLTSKPDLVLIDAETFDTGGIPQIPIIQGDAKSVSIAAASIVAKVTRDRIMDEYDLQYPQYGFKQHKGYGTKEHVQAIKLFGISPIHRISFTKNFYTQKLR